MPEVTPNIGENCHRAGGGHFFSPPKPAGLNGESRPVSRDLAAAGAAPRRRRAPFLFRVYRMGPRKPESKVLISDSIVRDFAAQAPLPAFCEPLPQSPSVPLLSAAAAGGPGPKRCPGAGGRRQGLTAPWRLPSRAGEKDPVLSPCCPRLLSTQVSGGATLQVSNSSSWEKGHPWVHRLAPSPCPQSGDTGWPGMGTLVSTDGHARGRTFGHAQQDEASSKMLTQHQLSTIRGEDALGPAPTASPTSPLCISQHAQGQRHFFPSPSWELTAAAHPSGGISPPKKTPAPQDGCAGAQRGPSPVGSPGPAGSAAETPPAICLAERRCRR